MRTRWRRVACRSCRSTSSSRPRRSSASCRRTCRRRCLSWFNGESAARPTRGVISHRDTTIHCARDTLSSRRRGHQSHAAGSPRPATTNNSQSRDSEPKFDFFSLIWRAQDERDSMFSFETFKLFPLSIARYEILHRIKIVVKVRQSKIYDEPDEKKKKKSWLCTSWLAAWLDDEKISLLKKLNKKKFLFDFCYECFLNVSLIAERKKF